MDVPLVFAKLGVSSFGGPFVLLTVWQAAPLLAVVMTAVGGIVLAIAGLR
jgi:hypothetical protein